MFDLLIAFLSLACFASRRVKKSVSSIQIKQSQWLVLKLKKNAHYEVNYIII